MTWEYLAGFFDGEGHVGLHMNGKHVRPMVSITQSEPREKVLYDIQKFLKRSGIVSHVHVITRSQNQSWNPKHTLNVCDQASIALFLDNLMPHLRLKKAEAKEVRNWIVKRVKERAQVSSRGPKVVLGGIPIT